MSKQKKGFLVPDRFRPVLGAFIFFVFMLTAFIIASPVVFLNVGIYSAVFLTLPLFAIMGMSLVYVVAAGEIDLSFPGIIPLSGLTFAWTMQQSNLNLALSASLAVGVGMACGLINGILVTKLGLSSLITTLGTNFTFFGLTNVLNNGAVRSFEEFIDFKITSLLVGSIGPIPAQMFWMAGIAVILGMIFHRHKFGLHVRVAGDNPEAGRAMGVNIERTKILCFILVGLCSSIVAILTIFLLSTYFSTMGEAYLLPTLAAVFVGGTALTGGKGTIGGMVIGASTIVFIQTGVVAAGLDGHWTQLGFGLVIVLSLLGHRRFSGRLSR